MNTYLSSYKESKNRFFESYLSQLASNVELFELIKEDETHYLEALRFSYEEQAFDAFVNGVLSFSHYQIYYGDYDSCIENVDLALAVSNKQQAISLRLILGRLEEMRSNFDAAESHYLQIISQDQGDDSMELLGSTYLQLGSIYGRRGDLSTCETFLEKGWKIVAELTDPGLKSAYCVNLGTVNLYQNNFDKALRFYESGLNLVTKDTFPVRYVDSLTGMASVHNYQGMPQNALPLFSEAEVIAREFQLDRSVELILSNKSTIFRELGLYEDGLLTINNAIEISRKLGERSRTAVNLSTKGDILRLNGQWEEAESALLEALELSNSMNLMSNLVYTLTNLGDLSTAKRDFSAARNYLNSAKDLIEVDSMKAAFTDHLCALGRLNLLTDNTKDALQNFQEAYDLAGKIGIYHIRGICLFEMAKINKRMGNNSLADEQYRLSHDIFALSQNALILEDLEEWHSAST